MKSLKEHLMNSIMESQTVPLTGSFHTQELIEFAAKFNKFNSDDEEDWAGWDDCNIDPEWAMENKQLIKKFCDLCKKIVNSKISMSNPFLGNFFGFGETEDPAEVMSEIGCKPGDYVFCYLTDGDDGEFFCMYCDGKDKNSIKLIDEFTKMTHDPAGWEPMVEYAPSN